MRSRIITGVLLFALFLIVVYKNNPYLNYILLGIVYCFAFKESLDLYGISNKKLTYAALIIYGFLPFTDPIFLSIVAVMFVASVLAYQKNENLKIVAPFIYPTIPILMMWMLLLQYGIEYLVWLILRVKFGLKCV